MPSRPAPRAPRRLARALVALVAAWTVLVGLPGLASAHDGLIGIEPGDGSMLDAPPTQVVLTFSAPQLALGAGTAVSVTDAAGVEWAEGDPTVQGEVVTQALRPGQSPGPHTVLWRSVASDGHPITGSTTYTVEAPASPAPSSSPAASVSPTTPGPAASPVDAANPGAVPTERSAGGDPTSGAGLGFLPLAVAGTAAGAVALAAVLAARRRGGQS